MDNKILAILESLATFNLSLQSFDLLVEIKTALRVLLDHLVDPLDLVTRMGSLLPVLAEARILSAHCMDLQ